MNYLAMLLCALIIGSCTKENQNVNEELSATKASYELGEDNEFLFGAELYKRSTGVQLYDLNQLQLELEEGLESGENESPEELENVQIEIERLNIFQEYLIGVRPPRPSGPKPPKGCLEENNCNPQIDISITEGILLSEGIEIEAIEIRDDNGVLVGGGTEIFEDSFGNPALAIEKDFNGEAIMYITINTEMGEVGTIVTQTPVLNQQ